MRDMIQLRGDPESSRIFMRNGHEMLPFENIVPLESMSSKQDCALFCFGNHQKKRPDNLVLGRNYDGKVLDMFEFGIEDFKGMKDFPGIQEVSGDIKPALIFQGEQFEFSDKHARLRNLLYGILNNDLNHNFQNYSIRET